MFTIEEFLRISNQMRDYYAKKTHLIKQDIDIINVK